MITLYDVISTDGFIARVNGEEDFIPDELWAITLAFFQKYDCLVMGRKTYETMQKYDPQSLALFEHLKIRKVVVTTNMDFKAKRGYIIVHRAEDIVNFGKNILVSSGPTLNNYLLENNMVNAVVFHKLVVPIGIGIRPFDYKFNNKLKLVSETPINVLAKEVIYQV